MEYIFKKTNKVFNERCSTLTFKYQLNNDVDIVVEIVRFHTFYDNRCFPSSAPTYRYRVTFMSDDLGWGRNNNFKHTMNNTVHFCTIRQVIGHIKSSLKRNKLFNSGVDTIVFPDDF